MSEPFPSKEYIEEAQKHPWLQERWEPRVGDCIRYPRYEDFRLEPIGWEVGYICATDYSLKVTVFQGLYGNTEDWYWWPKGKVIWLPSLRQLIDMLEERGYNWELVRRYPLNYPEKPPYYIASAMRPNAGSTMDGPSPEIATLRALAEVMKEKEDE